MSDPYWSNVVLLLHCDGSDGSTTFTDNSGSGHTITAVGNAQVDTAQSKFGGASCWLGTAADRITAPAGASWQFGAGDFTVEFWARLDTVPVGYNEDFCSSWDSTGWGVYFDLASGANLLGFYFEDDALNYYEVARSFTFAADTWYHIAVSRVGTNLYLFANGTQLGAAYNIGTKTLSAADWVMAFGTTFTTIARWYDEIRITKGTGRYAASFTPATERFPNADEAVGSGALAAAAAAVAGAGDVGGPKTGTGALSAAAATIAGLGGGYIVPTVYPPALVAQAAALAGAGWTGKVSAVPIGIDCAYTGSSGLPIIINPRRSGTTTLDIGIGPYSGTSTLPIGINPKRSGTSSLTIAIYGEVATEAAGDAVTWKGKALVNGSDLSARLTGRATIEAEERAATVATLSYLPADGTVDPLALVGKPVVLSWQQVDSAGAVTYERLRFTGIVSAPAWDANQRLMTLECTGNLQGKLDAMDKTAVLATVGGMFSETVFGSAADMTSFEYAEAVVSTTDTVLWQDAAGSIRTTSVLAKSSPDYTFTESDILSDSLGIGFAQLTDLINEFRVAMDYRFRRRRERQITVTWQPHIPICDWLTEGFELPERTMIASAAASGGWVVIGDITYTPVWPGGGYPCLSGGEQTYFVNNPAVTDDFCIAASWKAARRWMQTVTEAWTFTVRAPDSQTALGILAAEEEYALESEDDDEDWQDSLEYEARMSGTNVFTVPGSLDLAENLDGNRADFETAQVVALSKARNEILKSHRNTSVVFGLPYAPMLDLSHTVTIDTTAIVAKGKVRRITDVWDFDTGEATTEVEIALSRRNAAGTASDTSITTPAQPTDPDETVPDTILSLGWHMGGRAYSPTYSDSWDGYISNYTEDLSDWNKNYLNPTVKVYDESFTVHYPDVDSSYTVAANAQTPAVYTVDVPEDTLTLTSY